MTVPPRVLIVEDEPLIAMMLRDWVSDMGYDSIGPAHHVEAALALLERAKPDVALLDIALGSQHCFPVADALCARRIPFTFASGRGGTAIPPRYESVPVLLKPFVFERVRDAIVALLNGSARPR